MKPHIKVEITVGTLRSMNVAQFEALKNNVLDDDRWETAGGVRITGHGDYIGVTPRQYEHGGDDFMFLGIEKDGYTHS